MKDRLFHPYMRVAIPLIFMLMYGISINVATNDPSGFGVRFWSIVIFLVVVCLPSHCYYELQSRRYIEEIAETPWIKAHLTSLAPDLKQRHRGMMSNGEMDKVLEESEKFNEAMNNE